MQSSKFIQMRRVCRRIKWGMQHRGVLVCIPDKQQPMKFTLWLNGRLYGRNVMIQPQPFGSDSTNQGVAVHTLQVYFSE